MEMFTWFVAPILVLILIAVYFFRSLRKRITYFFPKNSPRKNKIIAALLMLAIFLPAVNIYGTWLIVILHVTGLMMISDLIVFIACKIRKNKSWNKWIKRIHYSGIAVVLACSLIMVYGYYNMFNVVKTSYEVTTSKPIRAEGYKAVLITDLHFGLSLSAEELSKYADEISSEKPDMVLLGGDIVDERTTFDEMKTAVHILGNIESSGGIYFIYGNHDKNQYSNGENYTKEQLDEELNSAGITILENSDITINDELTIVGRSDYSDGDVSRVATDKLLANVDKNDEIIIVDHQPREYAEAKSAGADLILSGHTHGGQIWPAGVLSTLLHLNDRTYGYGSDDNLNEVVSSGIAGWRYPIRTEKHSEYVVINIKG